jgi:CYTH domain-containing protein
VKREGIIKMTNAETEKKYLLFEKGVDYSTPAICLICESLEQLTNNVIENGTKIKQGYLTLEKGKELARILEVDLDFEPVEARLRVKKDKKIFNMKGKGTLSRAETPDMEVSDAIFDQYWSLTEGKRIEKMRLKKEYFGLTAEIDLYTDGRDLIVAEIEDNLENLARIEPLGKDITEDSRYKNKNLAG